MSYNIEYNPELGKLYPSKTSKSGNGMLVKLGILLLAAVVSYAALQTGLARYLIPGDPEVTSAAFSGMVTMVGEGVPVGEAILSFCEAVITNAS